MSDSPDIVDRLRDLAAKPVMLAELTRAFRDAADEIERLDAALSEAEARGRALGLEEAIRICMRAPSCRASWRMPETPSAFPLSWPIGWPRTPWARER